MCCSVVSDVMIHDEGRTLRRIRFATCPTIGHNIGRTLRRIR